MSVLFVPLWLVLWSMYSSQAVFGRRHQASQDNDILPGWQGEVSSQSAHSRGRNAEKTELWVETISWQPRAFIFHGFLSHDECDHLIHLAEKRLARSLVVNEKDDGAVDNIRTSYSAPLMRGADLIVKQIENKIAQWTHLPVAHGEPIEVLRYMNGQKYDAHWDWFDEKTIKDDFGNRIATVLMYLSDVLPDSGGETALPLADPLDAELQSIDGYSVCASKMGISVIPHKGDALLFWDMMPNQTVDRHALHASCPTFHGAKWTATKWIHNKRLG